MYKNVCFMLVSNDTLELPIFVSNTLHELSLILDIPYGTVKSAYKKNSCIRKYNGKIEKVILDIDNL